VLHLRLLESDMENFAQLTKQMSWRYVTVYCFLLLYIYIYIYINSSWVLKFGVTHGTWKLWLSFYVLSKLQHFWSQINISVCKPQVCLLSYNPPPPPHFPAVKSISLISCAIGYQHCYQEVSWRNLVFLSIKWWALVSVSDPTKSEDNRFVISQNI